MTRLLADVAFVAAQHGPELLPLVHQIMDEVRPPCAAAYAACAVLRAIQERECGALPVRGGAAG